MEPYQQRVSDERKELSSKLKRLDEYLVSQMDGDRSISNTELDNLMAQSRIMQKYLDILDARIAWLNT